MLFVRSRTYMTGPPLLSWSRLPRYASTNASGRHSAYETTFPKAPSAYGWQYHLDNTIQFILWAAFGSAAIHLLNIKQKYAEKDRRLSTKIAILKDIIRRVGEGEDVDIARELKVGKTEEEREWEQIMDSFREDSDVEATQQPLSGEAGPRSVSSKDSMSSSVTVPFIQSPKIDVKSGWFWR